MTRTDRLLDALKRLPPGFDSWAALIQEVRARVEFCARLTKFDSIKETFCRGMVHGFGGEVPCDPATFRQNTRLFQQWLRSDLVRLLSQLPTREEELLAAIEQLTDAEQRELLSEHRTMAGFLKNFQECLELLKKSFSLAGRPPVAENKKRDVEQTLRVLIKRQHRPAAKAVLETALTHKLSERTVWKILKESTTVQTRANYVTTEPIARDQRQASPVTDQHTVGGSSLSDGVKQSRARKVPAPPNTGKPNLRRSR